MRRVGREVRAGRCVLGLGWVGVGGTIGYWGVWLRGREVRAGRGRVAGRGRREGMRSGDARTAALDILNLASP